MKKHKEGKLILNGPLIIDPWLHGRIRPFIGIGRGASLRINGEFSIGDDVKINLFPGAKFVLGGRNIESASGITGRSIVLVHSSLEIGQDVLIAWDTFITDSDWHRIEGRNHVENTKIGNHVWIATSSRILKGVHIGDNSIVACGSTVLRGDYPPNSLIAGTPATVVESGIRNWHREI